MRNGGLASMSTRALQTAGAWLHLAVKDNVALKGLENAFSSRTSLSARLSVPMFIHERPTRTFTSIAAADGGAEAVDAAALDADGAASPEPDASEATKSGAFEATESGASEATKSSATPILKNDTNGRPHEEFFQGLFKVCSNFCCPKNWCPCHELLPPEEVVNGHDQSIFVLCPRLPYLDGWPTRLCKRF